MKLLAVILAIAVVQVRGKAVNMDPGVLMDDDHNHDMDMGNDTDGGMDGGHSGHSMKMYFHHTSHATILFKGWHTMVYWELFMSCLAVMVFAALYEGYKTMRENILVSMSNKRQVLPVTAPGATSNGKYTESTEQFSVAQPCQKQQLSWSAGLCDATHLVQGLLHIGQVWISYCLMLVFMTYNIWLCIAVCLGAGLGYWLFCQSRTLNSREANEHCN